MYFEILTLFKAKKKKKIRAFPVERSEAVAFPVSAGTVPAQMEVQYALLPVMNEGSVAFIRMIIVLREDML